MYRMAVIARHTFMQAVTQPIFWLIMALGAAITGIFAFLPFFTLGEDTRMFKAVVMDVVLLLSLLVTLLAASRSIYEEIEDRTMLTLMSKPLFRWEVLTGKYIGLIVSAAVMVLVLGLVLALCTHIRVPVDYMMRTRSLYPEEMKRLADIRWMHLAGIGPSMVLIWLQVCLLAAVSVAVSTRFSFVVNLPIVIMIYIAGNLSRFVGPAVEDGGAIARGLGWVLQTLVPYLAAFDLRDWTVYSTVRLPGTMYADATDGVTLSMIWRGTLNAAVYASLYVVAALSLGLVLFRNRELGGAEG